GVGQGRAGVAQGQYPGVAVDHGQRPGLVDRLDRGATWPDADVAVGVDQPGQDVAGRGEGRRAGHGRTADPVTNQPQVHDLVVGEEDTPHVPGGHRLTC